MGYNLYLNIYIRPEVTLSADYPTALIANKNAQINELDAKLGMVRGENRSLKSAKNELIKAGGLTLVGSFAAGVLDKALPAPAGGAFKPSMGLGIVAIGAGYMADSPRAVDIGIGMLSPHVYAMGLDAGEKMAASWAGVSSIGK